MDFAEVVLGSRRCERHGTEGTAGLRRPRVGAARECHGVCGGTGERPGNSATLLYVDRLRAEEVVLHIHGGGRWWRGGSGGGKPRRGRAPRRPRHPPGGGPHA